MEFSAILYVGDDDEEITSSWFLDVFWSIAFSEVWKWTLGFMHDALYCGKRYRTLNVLDEGTRECLAIEVYSTTRVLAQT